MSNKRQKAKYSALRPELNLRTRYDLIDYDYLDQLGPEELEWLNTFTEEYVNTTFSKDKNERIHPKKPLKKLIKKTGKIKKMDLYKNEAEHRNNARNSCIFTRAKASGTLYYSFDGVNEDEKELEKLNDTKNNSRKKRKKTKKL